MMNRDLAFRKLTCQRFETLHASFRRLYQTWRWFRFRFETEDVETMEASAPSRTSDTSTTWPHARLFSAARTNRSRSTGKGPGAESGRIWDSERVTGNASPWKCLPVGHPGGVVPPIRRAMADFRGSIRSSSAVSFAALIEWQRQDGRSSATQFLARRATA